jgi:hypothetical protein
MTSQQILLTSLSEGLKVEESEITGTKSNIFFTGTKTGIRSYYRDEKRYLPLFFR